MDRSPVKVVAGGLSHETKDEDLRAAFAEYGTPISASVVTDRGRRRRHQHRLIATSGPRGPDVIRLLPGACFEPVEQAATSPAPRRTVAADGAVSDDRIATLSRQALTLASWPWESAPSAG
jgi:hypothetical protein